jgi:signal peptidase II
MYYFGLSFVLIVCDQLLKKYISSILPLCQPGYCDSIQVLPIFKLMVLHNSGAAFSFLNDGGGWQRWFLVVVSTTVSIFIATWLFRVYRERKLLAYALAFILGGAIGNLIDRVSQGYVVDFFVFYYDVYYFPAFNIADSAITVGAMLLILDMILHREPVKEAADG